MRFWITSGIAFCCLVTISPTQAQNYLRPVESIVRTGGIPAWSSISNRWTVVDISDLVAPVCLANRGGPNANQFIITGRGGLPPNPRQVLSSNAVQVDWVELDASQENRSSTKPATNSTIESASTTIVEASGWMTNDKGEIVLTATVPTVTLNIPWLPKSECNAPEQKF